MIFRTNYRSIKQVDHHSRKDREALAGQPTAVTHHATAGEPALPNADEEEFLHGEEWELWCELMEKLVQPVDAERLLQRLLAESCVERRGNRFDSQRAASRRNWFAACAAVTVALIATVAVVASLVPGPNREILQMLLGSYPTDTRDYGHFAEPDAARAQTSQVEKGLAVAGLPELAQSSYDGAHAVPAGQAVDAALTRVSVELAAVPYWNEAARHWPIAHQLELLQAELAQSAF
ncbi:MAG: hypothetical protein KatS3mg109_0253 [Pirellulaceae bacterium]|nr:MAG: hypothetical protein KatS3mg109_0253 [Pirellulaceae bacterium]